MLHLSHKPEIPHSCFVAASADLIGAVTLGEESSVWFQCVLRADVMPITIGSQTNIQDGTIIHGSLNKARTIIGNRVSVGHKAILHGCTIDEDCLIGMGATVMDLAHVPKNSIVAAGSLVTERSQFEEGMLILGSPAKAVRPLKEGELKWIKSNALHYVSYAKSYKNKDEVIIYEN